MEFNNPLTELLNIKYPIIQAPMAGGITTPELVASVSNNGGLGSIGAAYMQPEALQKLIQAVKQLTDKPFAVNLFVPEPGDQIYNDQTKICKILTEVTKELAIDIKPIELPYKPSFDKQLAVIIAEQVPIFSFTFGLLETKYLDELKRHNIKIIGTATSVKEAQQLSATDIDAIVGQGIEAGGHRGTFADPSQETQIGTLALTLQLVDKINLPIIAAGGISDPRGVRAALDLGAQAVQIGTAFLTTHESGAHSKYKQALLEIADDNTMLTKAYSGRLARAIKNKFSERMRKYENDIMPFPQQNKLTIQIRTKAKKEGNTDFMSLWAGQNAHLCKSISAAKLMRELIARI